MSTAVLLAVAVGGGKDESALKRFMQNSLSWRLHRKDNDGSTDLDEALSRGLRRLSMVFIPSAPQVLDFSDFANIFIILLISTASSF
ncbi:MAG: hypothetical protein P9X24_07340 [Candidatus Hatepunaea meridiana]|nr:hypothetical protein [Candidatus Hatepunaea meridiana]